MGKFDKDRYQKETSIRFCLARGLAPFIEVLVFSSSDLSATTEVLTDLDVVGLEFVGDGSFRRVIFDCKTTSKLSPVNRAFWASGVMQYSGCDSAVVILKSKAVHNHRISALQLQVDLHDDQSFEDFGKTGAIDFHSDRYYQSSIDRWNTLFEIYQKNAWSEPIYALCHSAVPLTKEPWTVFRRVVGLFREVRGHLDPRKSGHLAIFLDTLSALCILWSLMGRDIRRFYSPGLKKESFSEVLQYYIWGGRDSFLVRQDLMKKFDDQKKASLELPAWGKFANLAGIIISAPQECFSCAHLTKEVAFRKAVGPLPTHDALLSRNIASQKRLMQFVPAVADYMIEACGLPKDFSAAVFDELQIKSTIPASSP